MRYFRSICLSIVLFLFFTTQVSSQDKNQENEEEKQKQKRPPIGLIRKDSLSHDIKKLDPPKRNIFILNSAGRLEVDEIQNVNAGQLAELPNIGALETEQISAQPLGLSYIGYIKSTQKITALILFEGEALAVDVGEEIAEGVSILKITPEDITVIGIGPDQEPRKFPLGGETL